MAEFCGSSWNLVAKVESYRY